MCVFDTFNKFLDTVLYQSHKSILTYLIQNKKRASVLLILCQRFVLKSNRRHFQSLLFTSFHIDFLQFNLSQQILYLTRAKSIKNFTLNQYLYYIPYQELYHCFSKIQFSNILKYKKKRLCKNSIPVENGFPPAYFPLFSLKD